MWQTENNDLIFSKFGYSILNQTSNTDFTNETISNTTDLISNATAAAATFSSASSEYFKWVPWIFLFNWIK